VAQGIQLGWRSEKNFEMAWWEVFVDQFYLHLKQFYTGTE